MYPESLRSCKVDKIRDGFGEEISHLLDNPFANVKLMNQLFYFPFLSQIREVPMSMSAERLLLLLTTG